MQIKTALILCAGYGKRLNPLTLTKPKPLLDLYNKTLLEHSLNLIKKLNIQRVKLNTFYLREQFIKFFEEKNFGLDVEIINDGEEILDTGGGILNIVKDVKEENFLILNPDTYWNEDYIKLIMDMEKVYNEKKMDNILLVVNKNLSFDKKLIGDFNLKNLNLDKKNHKDFIYTGCQILNKRIFNNLKISKFSMNKIWDILISKNQLFGFESKNKFIHITDLKVYEEVLKNY